MKVYLELLIGFLKVGCFAFGGGYGAIPLIRDIVLGYGWLSEEKLAYLIAVSESTPGPIMVNLATYVGSEQGGLLGAFIATFGVILPSFIIILILTSILKNALENKYAQRFLDGIKPSVVGIVLATGITLVLGNCFSGITVSSIDVKALIITICLVISMSGYKKIKKKNISPILLIIIAAVAGMVVYSR